jgi:predicted dienelactone hydrolase
VSVLEIAVVVGAVAVVLARWAPARFRRPVTIAAVALLVLAGVALAVTGLRWQLVPVLVGAVIALPFALGWLRRSGTRRVRWWWAAPGTVVCLALVALGPLAAWGFPVPVLPRPTGAYAVGTSVLQWTDADRPEPATADPADHRQVVAQLWYPARAVAPDAERAQYLGRTEDEARTVSRAFAETFGLPAFLVDGVAHARSNAVPDAAPADGRFPVVLFSPGSNGVRGQDTAWAEELASRGYLVAGLDHLYDSPAVVLDDGTVVPGRVSAAYAAAYDSDDPAAPERVTAELTELRAGDLSSALTQLGRLDRGEVPGPLAGRIDVGHAAVTGHSFGGATAVRTLAEDPRFAAAVDLDGGLNDPPTSPFDRPVLAVTSDAYHDEAGNPGYATGLDHVLDLARTGYRLTVPGSGHLDFTDLPLWLPPIPGFLGWTARSTSQATTAGVTTAFLDHVLRGVPGDPAADLARYGELAVHQR